MVDACKRHALDHGLTYVAMIAICLCEQLPITWNPVTRIADNRISRFMT